MGLLRTFPSLRSLFARRRPRIASTHRFQKTDRLLILANVLSIWEVAVAASTDLFPRDGGEWHIPIAVLWNEQRTASILWRAMRCTSIFYKAFQRAGDAARFQEFVELFAPHVILGEAALSQCRILLTEKVSRFRVRTDLENLELRASCSEPLKLNGNDHRLLRNLGGCSTVA
jgi:hypothetical protein